MLIVVGTKSCKITAQVSLKFFEITGLTGRYYSRGSRVTVVYNSEREVFGMVSREERKRVYNLYKERVHRCNKEDVYIDTEESLKIRERNESKRQSESRLVNE